jgi:hypothetical protein
MMKTRRLVVLIGCSRQPDRFEAPEVDTAAAAARAIEQYDTNGDAALDKEELVKCPGILSKVAVYDQNGNGSVEQDEIAEPYLGEQVQAAQGLTDGSGSTDLGIPTEYVPEHLRRIKSVHYGTFKVRITHPTIKIPEKYNSATTLGYETQPGDPYVRFTLTSK